MIRTNSRIFSNNNRLIFRSIKWVSHKIIPTWARMLNYSRIRISTIKINLSLNNSFKAKSTHNNSFKAKSTHNNSFKAKSTHNNSFKTNLTYNNYHKCINSLRYSNKSRVRVSSLLFIIIKLIIPNEFIEKKIRPM